MSHLTHSLGPRIEYAPRQAGTREERRRPGTVARALLGTVGEGSACNTVCLRSRAKLASVVDAYKADGTVRVDIDPETLIDAIVGAYVTERARKGHGNDWADRLFTVFWPAARARSL
jgi:hypothetical protein